MNKFDFSAATTLSIREFMTSNGYETIEQGVNKNGNLFLIINKNKANQRFLNCSKNLTENDVKSGNFDITVGMQDEEGNSFDLAVKKAESKMTVISF